MRASASRTSRRKPDAFLRGAQHPTLGRGYLECAYAPMIELLDYFAANGFDTYTLVPAPDQLLAFLESR